MSPLRSLPLVLVLAVGSGTAGSAWAYDVPWRNDLGLGLGLFSGSGVRFARRFPEGVRVGLTAGYLEPADPGGLGTRLASVGTEVIVDLTRGRVGRVLAVAGLGWNLASDWDPDQDEVAEDAELLVVGVGGGIEVLYFRNLSLTGHILVGANLLEARIVVFPELTLSYGF